jgi:hypothetical protein
MGMHTSSVAPGYTVDSYTTMAPLHVLADALGGLHQRGEIRLVGVIHRGRHGDDDEVGFADDLRVGAAGEVRGGLEVFVLTSPVGSTKRP